jgi:hypothetical protein
MLDPAGRTERRDRITAWWASGGTHNSASVPVNGLNVGVQIDRSASTIVGSELGADHRLPRPAARWIRPAVPYVLEPAFRGYPASGFVDAGCGAVA